MKLMTIPKAASEVGVNAQTLRRAVKCGEIAAMPMGNRMMLDVDAVRVWRDGRRNFDDGLISMRELSGKTGLKGCAIRRGMQEGWLPYEYINGKFWFDEDAVIVAITERMR